MLHLFLAASLAAAPLPKLGTPQLFEPGVVSGPASDSAPTFSPDGNTLLFTRSSTWGVILESHRRNGRWSQPTIAGFSGRWNDWSPEFSPDGRYVVFVEVRPKIGANLWRVDRVGDGWGVPTRLPAAVNIGRSQWKASIAADGSIYFVAIDTKGGKRLYRSQFSHGAYEPAQPVSFSDGTHGDVDPEVAPDESFMIFASNGRVPGDTLDHLFFVRRAAGAWGDPVPLRYAGDDVPARSTDNEPHLSADRLTLYFSSDRSLPAPFPRTPAQARAAVARLESWDNTNLNVWSVPLLPLLADDVTAQLQAMNDADCAYAKTRNWSALAKTLAPEYVGVNADGSKEGRAALIKDLNAPSADRTTACATTVSAVKQSGDRVYLFGVYTESGTQGPKHRPYRSVERIRDTWKRVDGAWLQTESLSYELTYTVAGKVVAHFHLPAGLPQ